MTLTEKAPSGSAAATVSQSEIESLLSQFGVGDAPLADIDPSLASADARATLGKHQFPQLSFFSPMELRKLRLRHEELIRYAGAQLASYLRLETVLQMSKIETMPFQKFLDGLADPTHLTLFKLPPLRGTCLIEIPPRLGLCLVDRQLGGQALKVDTSRNLSEIEVRLVSRVAELLLNEWCSYWSSLIDLRASIVGHEGNGRFVQTSAPDTMMLVLGVTAWVGGETVEEMQIAFPHHTLEPLIAKLSAQSQGDPETDAATRGALQWNSALEDLPVTLGVELPSITVSTRKLAELKVGDIIPFHSDVAKKVLLRVGGLPKFTGELGAVNDHRAVKITATQKSKTPPKRA